LAISGIPSQRWDRTGSSWLGRSSLIQLDAVLIVSVNGEPRRTKFRLAGSAAPVREHQYSVR
jgi:hypothetical protein